MPSSTSEGEPERCASILRSMIDEVAGAPGVLGPSSFWEDFSRRNMAQLEDDGGFGSFKRSVNDNYFQWVITSHRHPDFRAVWRLWLRHPVGRPWRARVEDREVPWFHDERPGELPPRLRPRAYALHVGLLWEYARRRAGAAVAERVEEPLLGKPITVRHRGRRITQDLANSLLEYAAISEGVPHHRRERSRLLEIGGGYGRLAWLWLTLHPAARLVMVDIPPALALSQAYLTTLFPTRRALHFRPGAEPRSLHDAVMASDLAFLTPNQFESLGPLQADVGLNISSLHEMRPEQISRYLELVDRHVKGGFFYTKQWERWTNPMDDVVVDRRTYPYPKHWRTVFERTHPVQIRFFEALFAL